MPAKEHLGHLGLSSRGSGIRPEAAMARMPHSRSSVRDTRASSKGDRHPEVDTGDGSQGIVGEQHGPCVYGLWGFAVLLCHVRSDAAGPRGQLARRAVHPAVLESAPGGVDAVGEFTLHPFQVGQAVAVGVLVEHPGGNYFRKRVV